MVAGNIALVFGNRNANATQPNPALRWIVTGSLSGLALVLTLPVLRELFHFSGNVTLILACGLLAAGTVSLLVMALKLVTSSEK